MLMMLAWFSAFWLAGRAADAHDVGAVFGFVWVAASASDAHDAGPLLGIG